MNFISNFFWIGPCGFVYLILALQVCFGFPPFYQKGNEKEEMQALMPLMFAIMITLVLSTFATIVISDSFLFLLILFGALSIWTGVKARKMVQLRTSGPLPWLLTPLTIGVMNRRPMLVFDVWTIGFTALIALAL